MSSFNSWLIIVFLLFNVLLYRSSARPTYPPSGEFLHQLNTFYRYLKITDCASFAVFPERQAHLTRCIINYILFGLDYAWHTPENVILPSHPKGISQVFFTDISWQPKNYKSYSIVFKDYGNCGNVAANLYSAVFDVFMLKQEIRESQDLA